MWQLRQIDLDRRQCANGEQEQQSWLIMWFKRYDDGDYDVALLAMSNCILHLAQIAWKRKLKKKKNRATAAACLKTEITNLNLVHKTKEYFLFIEETLQNFFK